MFPIDPGPSGDRQGDRLAVLPELRSRHVGGPLTAPSSPAFNGGHRLTALVQVAHRVFFRRTAPARGRRTS